MAHSASIIKVKKDRFIFTLDSPGKVKKGTLVIIHTQNGDNILANVLDSGKKKALAKLQNPEQSREIKKGFEVSLKESIVQEVPQTKKKKKKKEEVKSIDKEKKSDPEEKITGNGFFIEPLASLTYGSFSQQSTTTGTFPGTGKISGKAMGINLGALLGYKTGDFYFGSLIDLTKGSLKSQVNESDANSSNTTQTEEIEDSSYIQNMIAGYLGYQVTEKNRIWLNLGIISKAATNSANVKTIYTGLAYGAGANWKLSEKIFANMSILMASYSIQNDKSVTESVVINGGLDQIVREPLKETSISLGVSYLFDFFN